MTTAPDNKASWAVRLGRLIAVITKRSKNEASFARANCESVRRSVRGLGPDSQWVVDTAGARMVVNLSSAHVPSFCDAVRRKDQRPYKNCYDLSLLSGPKVARTRVLVDSALPLPPTQTKEDTYFGAVELHGTGIRFFGDVCLVLRSDAVAAATVLLERNSFDLVRSPVKEAIASELPTNQAGARRDFLASWSGTWAADIGTIASIKALKGLGSTGRRWTVGQISQALRDDEDYIEVLKGDSFGPGDLQEARISASDAAHDALTAARLSSGPLPRLEAMIWRNRRSRAEGALRRVGVPVRIVTSPGRTRG